jgi:hypothetical protein
MSDSANTVNLKADINTLRGGKGCSLLSHINKAENLNRFIGCEGFSDEGKKACLKALITECFKTEIENTGMFLASLNLNHDEEYKKFASISKRCYEHQIKYLPKVHVEERMLRNYADDYRDSFVKWLIDEKKTGKVNEIRDRVFKENTPKQRPVRKYKHNLLPRNKNYIGRKNQVSLLDDIFDYFNSNQTIPNEQLIYGMGGVGKTQVANEYAHSFGSKYSVICRLTADTALDEAVEFIKFMKPKEYERFQNIPDNSSALISAFRQWLEDNIEWLLIFDDVDNQQQIEEYIPHGSNGHILITSRTALKEIDKKIHLEVFDEETAMSFLISRAKCDDNEGARTLALRLGCFPLALEQAAAYISADPNQSFSNYLSLLRKHGIDIFDKKYNNELPYYKHTVKTTWKISMEKLSVSAKQLLSMCSCIYFPNLSLFKQSAEAFFKSNSYAFVITDKDVPVQLFSDLCHDLKRNKPIQELVRYSLVNYESDSGRISFHPLVREVAWDEIKHDAVNIKHCLHLLDALFNDEYNLGSVYYIMRLAEDILSKDLSYRDYVWFKKRERDYKEVHVIAMYMPVYRNGKFRYREEKPETLLAIDKKAQELCNNNKALVVFVVEEAE